LAHVCPCRVVNRCVRLNIAGISRTLTESMASGRCSAAWLSSLAGSRVGQGRGGRVRSDGRGERERGGGAPRAQPGLLVALNGLAAVVAGPFVEFVFDALAGERNHRRSRETPCELLSDSQAWHPSGVVLPHRTEGAVCNYHLPTARRPTYLLLRLSGCSAGIPEAPLVQLYFRSCPCSRQRVAIRDGGR
jgi:hypothetical protein